MPNRIPIAAASNHGSEAKKAIKAYTPNVANLTPTWRFRRFDVESKWGLMSIFGGFVYHYSDDLLEAVCEAQDENLNNILESFNGKTFLGWEDFLRKLKEQYTKDLPSNILHHLCVQVSESIFTSIIWPKLRDYEQMQWGVIERAQHGKKGKSKNHFVDIANLNKEARDRLLKLGIKEDQLFSLRLDGLSRIYGIRETNVLEIVWVDLNHEIYPTDPD